MAGDTTENVFNVIDAFEVPKLTYSLDRKKFLSDQSMGLPQARLFAGDYFDLFPFETLNIFVSVDMKYFFETEEKTFGGFSAARINICFSPSPLFVATTSISPRLIFSSILLRRFHDSSFTKSFQ